MTDAIALLQFNLYFTYRILIFMEVLKFAVLFPFEVLRTLYNRLRKASSLPLEIQGALLSIALGQHFIDWDWEHFSDYFAPALSLSNKFMSASAWGFLFIAIGLVRIASIFYDWRIGRLGCTLACGACWYFWGFCFLASDPRPLISTALLIFAASSSICFGLLMRHEDNAK